ncbi:MAG: rRNA maturation RNase YbeY [Chloroflexi bacterium HGW-Chloroflexi-6]|nr:MAG: rRNA maturation RNase YbeY [Chloroflexi bacterium HGW-Chloroflexi-6]
MIFVETQYDQTPAALNDLVENAALAALKHQSAPENATVTIVLTDDEQMHSLNLDYLGVDAPTDVLSFPSEEIDPETGDPYLGDILISVPRAANQAESTGHDVESEAQLLTVHGILHLMGHDHAEPEEKERMWQAQAEILTKLGLGNIQVRES